MIWWQKQPGHGGKKMNILDLVSPWSVHGDMLPAPSAKYYATIALKNNTDPNTLATPTLWRMLGGFHSETCKRYTTSWKLPTLNFKGINSILQRCFGCCRLAVTKSRHFLEQICSIFLLKSVFLKEVLKALIARFAALTFISRNGPYCVAPLETERQNRCYWWPGILQYPSKKKSYHSAWHSKHTVHVTK